MLTEVGMAVVEALQELFPDILDSQFTAEMEEGLDRIARGEVGKLNVVSTLHRRIVSAKRVTTFKITNVYISKNRKL